MPLPPDTGKFRRPGEPSRPALQTPPQGSPTPAGTPLSRHEQAVLHSEMAAAAEFQKNLLPKELPSLPGYDFGAYFAGARPVSGDYYDFVPYPDGRVGVVIADASGKGVPAGMLISMARALVHARPDDAVSPDAVLSWVNAKLYPQVKRGMFVSMTYLLLDPPSHKLLVGNAGHLPTLVWRAAAKIVAVHPAKGVVLAAGAPAVFDGRLQVDEISLDPGDRVVLVTDGVNEAMAPGQREFGMEHLRRRLQADSDKASAELIRNMVAQIDIHRSGGEQSDDITLVTFRRIA